MNTIRNFLNRNKIYILIALIFLLSLLFFAFPVVITFDGSHYLRYVSIFNGALPFSSWDAVRGPIFPFLLYFSGAIFGQTSQGVLVFQFLFYLIYLTICYFLVEEIFKTSKNQIPKYLSFAFLALNPLIFGYFHVLLTEYLAITLTILNVFLAYKWCTGNYSKKQKMFFAIYFILSVTIAYHIKQPYFILALSPILIPSIISVIYNRRGKNVIYRFGTVIASIIVLFVSIFAWNKIMENGEVDLNSGRDSGSMFSSSLMEAARIEEKPSTLSESISILLTSFAKNPANIIGEYLKNYCATTSICAIESSDGVRYYISNNIDLLRTFENRIIGYRTFSENDNLFDLADELYPYASLYDTGDDKGIIAKLFRAGGFVSDIAFKFSTFTCPVFLILAFVFGKKFAKKNRNLYILCIICLSTALLQLLSNSFVGLIIDRYAVEAFIPAFVGIIGFFVLCFSKKTS